MDLTAQLLNLAPLGSDPFEHFTRFAKLEQSEANVPPRIAQVQRRLDTDQILELVAAYAAGTSLQDLIRRFGVSRTTVHAHLDQHGVPRQKGTRKLSDEDVAEAAQLHEDGWTVVRLAKRYSVSEETVRRALRRAGVQLRPRRGSQGPEVSPLPSSAKPAT